MKHYKVDNLKNRSKKITVTKIVELIQSILLALILTSTCIRVFKINLFNNSIFMPLLFGIFIVIGVIKYSKKSFFVKKEYLLLYFLVFLILVYDFIYVVFDFQLFLDWIKFILCIITAVIASKMKIDQIYKSLIITIILSFIFAIYSYINVDLIIHYMSFVNGLNYLVVTLPIGCAATITLLLTIFEKGLKKKFLNGFACIIFFMSMLKYSGRGNIIIPIVVVTIICIFKSFESFKDTLKIIIVLLIVIIFMKYIFENFTSEYLQIRFKNLFSDFESEDRISIYITYLTYILENFRWIIGIGFKQTVETFNFYPHNFILELFGENGIIGITTISILIFMTSRYIAKINFNIKKIKNMNKNEYNYLNKLFIIILGSVLYYFITFLKSFSVYDAYQVFITIGLIFAMKNKVEEKGE